MTDFLDEMERCVPRLRRYALSLTRDADFADDLVQDCLERALSRRHLWRPTGSLRGWLFRILHNIYANEVRRRVNRRTAMSVQALAEGQTPESQIDRLAVRDMETALAQLPSGQRAVLLLVVLEGMAYAEVAEVLAIPSGTVMSRLSRARARLRDLLDLGPVDVDRAPIDRAPIDRERP